MRLGLVLLLVGCCLAVTPANLLQMSTTNETLLIQLPTFSEATITSSIDGLPGVSYLNSTNTSYSLNGTQIIQVYHYIGDVAYWAPTVDGLLLFYMEQTITANYSGLVLYYDGTANQQYQTVILYNLTDQNTIQFDVAAPALDAQTDEVEIVILQTLTFNFSSPVGFNDYVFSCENLTILYIGGNNYTLFCELGANFSTWSIPTFENNGEVVSYAAQVYSNTDLDISQPLSIQNALVNPELYFGVPNNQLVWSMMFSSSNTVYICSISGNGSSPECASLNQLDGQVINIMSMVTNLYLPETFLQTKTTLYVLENQQSLVKVMDLNNSDYVFVTKKYIYVEIIQPTYTNLTIFDKDTLNEVGQLILTSKAFVVENDIIISSTQNGLNFFLFSPTILMIQPEAVPYIQNGTAPVTISVNITTPYSALQTTNYTLYFTPLNQTLFNVIQVNSSNGSTSMQLQSYIDLLVTELTQQVYVMGPLVQMLVATNPGIYNASTSTGFSVLLPLQEIEQLFNKPVVGTMLPGNPPTLLLQQNNQVMSLDSRTGRFQPTGIMLEGVVKTFVSEDMVYLAKANGDLLNCSLRYTDCRVFLSLRTNLTNNSSNQLLSFKKHRGVAFISLLDNEKLELVAKNHRTGSMRASQMPAGDLPPISEIISISLDQCYYGRIAILSTSNNVTFVVVDVNTTSSQNQYPNLTVSYNVTLPCTTPNASQMQLQPFGYVMVAYCYNQIFIYEYVVTNTDYYQLRLIPLYDFYTTNFGNFTNSLNFYFVPVTLNASIPPYFNGTNYRLVMQFGTYSASSMHQLINTTAPLMVVGNIADTIIYPVDKDSAMFMAFSEEVFLEVQVNTSSSQLQNGTLNQLVPLGIVSLFNYNYLQILSITFNLTSSQILYGSMAPRNVINFSLQTSSEKFTNFTVHTNQTLYFGEYFLELEWFNGTIQNFSVTNTTATMNKLPPTIHQVDMVEPNKIIGEVGDYFTSLIELDAVEYPILTGTTLTNLIIAISRDKLYIMEKVGSNNTDLNIILSQDTQGLPITSACRIHLYQVLSNTSANFLMSCGPTQFSSSGYPYALLVINYANGQLQPPPFISTVTMPYLLMEMTVIPSNNSLYDPLIIGLLPEAGNTASQTMVVCNTTSYSFFNNAQNRTTYVSIDYDVLTNYNQWLVASVNMVDLNFWYMPTPRPQNAPIGITCSISIQDLQDVTHENEVIFIDLISLVNGTVTMLVGGYQHYYLVSFLMANGSSSNLMELYRFRKYYECNGYDQFKPQYVFSPSFLNSNPNVNIAAMIIYCTENRTTLDYLSTRNLTSDNPIYTSFVQIFMPQPTNIETPIRVLQTDATDTGCLLSVYYGVNSTYSPDSQPGTTSNNVTNLKLLYQQIGGVLVDNRLTNAIGFVVLTNSPPTYNFAMTFYNSYYTQIVNVESYITLPKFVFKGFLPYIIVLGIYNVLVLASMIWWCYQRNRKEAEPPTPDVKSESDDGELRAYYNRLHDDCKNRSKERVFELEQFQ